MQAGIEQSERGTRMKTYRNISEEWGAAVGNVTLDDYITQARHFGIDPDCLTADDEHVYADGLPIADAE
jgi:hypothetical protein